MIFGIGIDLTSVNRFDKWINNNKICNKFYSEKEMDYIKSKGVNAVQSLAAGFAGKEAFGKALGTGLAGLSLKNISIIRDNKGKPVIELTGKALEKFKSCGKNPKVHISISHESLWAIAQVIIEVDNG